MQLKTASFSGHESFPFRHTWLTKGVTAFAKDPTIFSKDEAMVILGVGKNMVQSIRHWCPDGHCPRAYRKLRAASWRRPASSATPRDALQKGRKTGGTRAAVP